MADEIDIMKFDGDFGPLERSAKQSADSVKSSLAKAISEGVSSGGKLSQATTQGLEKFLARAATKLLPSKASRAGGISGERGREVLGNLAEAYEEIVSGMGSKVENLKIFAKQLSAQKGVSLRKGALIGLNTYFDMMLKSVDSANKALVEAAVQAESQIDVKTAAITQRKGAPGGTGGKFLSTTQRMRALESFQGAGSKEEKIRGLLSEPLFADILEPKGGEKPEAALQRATERIRKVFQSFGKKASRMAVQGTVEGISGRHVFGDRGLRDSGQGPPDDKGGGAAAAASGDDELNRLRRQIAKNFAQIERQSFVEQEKKLAAERRQSKSADKLAAAREVFAEKEIQRMARESAISFARSQKAQAERSRLIAKGVAVAEFEGALQVQRTGKKEEARGLTVDKLASRGFTSEQADKISKSLRGTRQALLGYNMATEITNRNQKLLTQSILQSTQTAGVFEKTINITARRLLVWAGATGILFGAQRAMRSLVGTIFDFSGSMARLNKLLPGSKSGFESLRKTATESAIALGVPITEVVKSMEAFSQKFKDQSTVAKLAADAILLNNISVNGLESSTENMIAAMSQFNLGAEKSRTIIDSWAAVSANAKVTADDLGDAVAGAGKAALAAGLNMHEFNGIVGAVAESTNASGKEIAATFRTVFERIQAPENAKKLQNLGILPFDATGEVRPFLHIIDDIRERIVAFRKESEKRHTRGGIVDESAVHRSTEAFKQQIAVAAAGARRYSSFLAIIDNLPRAMDLSEKSMDSFNAAAEQNRAIMESLPKKFEQTKAGFQAIALAAGKGGLETTFKILLNTVNGLMDRFAKIPSQIQALIVGFTSLAATVASVQFTMSAFNSPGVAGGLFGSVKGGRNLKMARQQLQAAAIMKTMPGNAAAGGAEFASAQVGFITRMTLALEGLTNVTLGRAFPAIMKLGAGLRAVFGGIIIGTVITAVFQLIKALDFLASGPLERAKKGFQVFGMVALEGTDQIDETIRKQKDLLSSTRTLIKTLEEQDKINKGFFGFETATEYFALQATAAQNYAEALKNATTEEEKLAIKAKIRELSTQSGVSGTAGIRRSLMMQDFGIQETIKDQALNKLYLASRQLGLMVSDAARLENNLKDVNGFIQKMAESILALNPIGTKTEDNILGISDRDKAIFATAAAFQVKVDAAKKELLELESTSPMRGGVPSAARFSGPTIEELKTSISVNEKIVAETLALSRVTKMTKTDSEGFYKELGKGAGKVKLVRDAISELEKSLANISLRQRTYKLGVDVLNDTTEAYSRGLDSLISSQVDWTLAILRNNDAQLDSRGTLKKLGFEQDKLGIVTEEQSAREEELSSIRTKEKNKLHDLNMENRNYAEGILDINAAIKNLASELDNLKIVSGTLNIFKGAFTEELSQAAQTLETRRKGEHDLAQDRINLNAQVYEEQRRLNQAIGDQDQNQIQQSQFRLKQLGQEFDAIDKRSKDLKKETSIIGGIGRNITGQALSKSIEAAVSTPFNLFGGALSKSLAPTSQEINMAIAAASKDPVTLAGIKAEISTADNVNQIFMLLRDRLPGGTISKSFGVSSSRSASLVFDSSGRAVADLGKLSGSGDEKAILGEELKVVNKQSKAADKLVLAAGLIQGAATGFGVTGAMGKKGFGGAIGGSLLGGAGSMVKIGGTAVGSILGPIGGLIGGLLGSLFDKKVEDEFVQPIIPPLDENTKATKENTNSVRMQTTELSKIINAPANFSLPAFAVKGGTGGLPGFQWGGMVARGGLAMVHAGERVVPAHQTSNSMGGLTININGGNGSPHDIAQEVIRKVEGAFRHQGQQAGLASRRL